MNAMNAPFSSMASIHTRLCITFSEEHLVRGEAILGNIVVCVRRGGSLEVAQRLCVIEHRHVALNLLAAHLRGDEVVGG